MISEKAECGGCRWFRMDKPGRRHDEGACYVYPPVIVAMGSGLLTQPHVRQSRPRVRMDDGCSLHQPKG